jgi:hypothetical protein
MDNCFKRPCSACTDPEFKECQDIQRAVQKKLDESLTQHYEPLDYFLKEMSNSDSNKTMAM